MVHPYRPACRRSARTWRTLLCHASLHREAYRLTYVEVFALAAHLYAVHAWYARPDGTVENPTWGSDGLAYPGIPFARVYLLDHEARADNYTVLLDQHRTGWRLLTRGLPERPLAPVGGPLQLA